LKEFEYKSLDLKVPFVDYEEKYKNLKIFQDEK